ncbi:unnamed protein product [Vitrella brassicaformis CCMP3155]|uniref:Intraflagellar transport protein 56 n=3 Tax=Vitrella brassicaformis TaxID=1169539 RepID=A0A0G4EVZ2_VITBC|nr:unnamed protein product [Vitrella brassicaformis CCMP3155]|eukprot:CEM02602.1 unnamed protein product [Vitrella brassicaformis CCMP3155]
MIRPGSALVKGGKPRRTPPGAAGQILTAGKKTDVKKPELLEFIERHDYTGATTLLEFERKAREERPNALLWLGYAAFHNGDYRKALDAYDEYLRSPSLHQQRAAGDVHVYRGCCLYALYRYKEAEEAAKKGTEGSLRTRLLFHIAHKANDEKKMVELHRQLQSSTEDQLCLAAIQYLRNHYQEATEIYKRLLMENRDHLALNVYVALCYYKLDYFDVALEILHSYTQVHSDSITGINLKACCHFQLYNGKAAEQELKALSNAAEAGTVLQDSDILRHNLVVFRNGDNALQVLPALVDVIPEARLNLVIYYLRTEEYQEAFQLLKDMEPNIPREYVLKGVVYAALGQKNESREYIRLAQQLFQLVGAAATECDTIPGRQCMASCFFLLKQFDDVLVYLRSIRGYFTNDDDFHWNFGIACAAAGEYKEAKDSLMAVQSDKYRSEFCYVSWVCRCHIMCGEPQMAWETYSRLEGSSDAFNLLTIIANDCYKMGQFYWSCRAFDVLERLDADPEYWDGKRGAAVGVFQQVIAGRETPERLQEVVSLLRSTNNPQVEYMINKVIKKWAKENRVNLDLD